MEDIIEIQNALIAGDGEITIADKFGQYKVNRLAFGAWSDNDYHWIVYLEDYDMVNVHEVHLLDISWWIVK